MPAFDCTIQNVDKIRITTKGVLAPLCNDCVQTDCENPIRKQVISVLGQPTEWRLWVVNSTIRMVTQCVGYVSTESDKQDADSAEDQHRTNTEQG